MGGLWTYGLGMALAETAGQAASGFVPIDGGQSRDELRRAKELQERLQRIALLNEALWRLLRERLQLTDEELTNLAATIAMRAAPEGTADAE